MGRVAIKHASFMLTERLLQTLSDYPNAITPVGTEQNVKKGARLSLLLQRRFASFETRSGYACALLRMR